MAAHGIFHFVAQDNVETVGHFVRIYADKAVLHMVDFPVEIFQRNLLKRWQQFAQLIVNGNPEILISAQNVFIKPGQKIHWYGSTRKPKEVIAAVCGKEVSAEPLIRYFKAKYTEIYGL